jgi:hypothetical protein
MSGYNLTSLEAGRDRRNKTDTLLPFCDIYVIFFETKNLIINSLVKNFFLSESACPANQRRACPAE